MRNTGSNLIIAICKSHVLIHDGIEYIFENLSELEKLTYKKLKILWDRFFRNNFISALWIENDEVLFNHLGKIYIADFHEQTIINLPFHKNIKCLNFFRREKENEVVFSPYYTNHRKKSVPVYSLDLNTKEINIITTFKRGLINHIHSFYELEGKLVANVGDFDETIGSWDLTSASAPKPLALSKSYRSVVCEKINQNEWLVIDDQPGGENSLKFYEGTPYTGSVSSIIPVDGPVIYGRRCGEFYYFTICAEPIRPTFINRWILNTEPSVSGLFSVNLTTRCVQYLASASKDKYPYALLGFGNFIFLPSQSSSQIWCQAPGLLINTLETNINLDKNLLRRLQVAKFSV